MADRAIQAVVFDLDNTLTDFLKAKDDAIRAAADAMIDAGLPMRRDEAHRTIYAIYATEGIEYQHVFNTFLQAAMGRVEDRILAAAVVAYRRARDGSLVLYPHANMVLNRLAREGYRLAVVSDAPRFEAWRRAVSSPACTTPSTVFTFGGTAGCASPTRACSALALEELRVAPHQAATVGDRPTRNILGARDHGLDPSTARYGDETAAATGEALTPVRRRPRRRRSPSSSRPRPAPRRARRCSTDGRRAAERKPQDRHRTADGRHRPRDHRRRHARPRPDERSGAGSSTRSTPVTGSCRRDRRPGGGGCGRQQRRRRPGHRAAAGPARRGGERPAADRGRPADRRARASFERSAPAAHLIAAIPGRWAEQLLGAGERRAPGDRRRAGHGFRAAAAGRAGRALRRLRRPRGAGAGGGHPLGRVRGRRPRRPRRRARERDR